MEKPEVILKIALSLDGFIDDVNDARLILSNKEDRESVLNLRNEADAILIGGNTLRKDNPKLTSGNSSLIRVILTKSGDISSKSDIFKEKNVLIFCLEEVKEKLIGELPANVRIESYSSDESSLEELLLYLSNNGVKQLLIEGGGGISREVIKRNLFDKIRIAHAPFFLGQRGAVSAVSLVDTNESLTGRLNLLRFEQLGDMLVAWYSKNN